MDLLKEDEASLNLDIPSMSSVLSGDTFVVSSTTSESAESQRSLGGDSTNGVEKLEAVLNTLHGHILEFCDSSLALQQKRDFLLLCISLLKKNDLLEELYETDREDVECYIQSIKTRLYSVDIKISESMDRIEELIHSMICGGNIAQTREHCKQYLNACDTLMFTKDEKGSNSNIFVDSDRSAITTHGDKKDEQSDAEFYALLLHCNKNDRESIRKRLCSLMDHLNYQIPNILH